MFGLVGATRGVYLHGTSTVLSPNTRDDANANSARGVSERKVCARELIVKSEVAAGMFDVDGSPGLLSSSAIPSRAYASLS